jgi:hypothetical protein
MITFYLSISYYFRAIVQISELRVAFDEIRLLEEIFNDLTVTKAYAICLHFLVSLLFSAAIKEDIFHNIICYYNMFLFVCWQSFVGSTVDDCCGFHENNVVPISKVPLKDNNNDDDAYFKDVIHHSKRDDKPVQIPSHHEEGSACFDTSSTVANTAGNSAAIDIEEVDIICLILPQQDEKDQEVVADNPTDSTELAAMMMATDGTTDEVNLLCPSSSSNNNSNSGEKRDESDETVESTQLPVGARELGESHPSSSQQVDV